MMHKDLAELLTQLDAGTLEHLRLAYPTISTAHLKKLSSAISKGNNNNLTSISINMCRTAIKMIDSGDTHESLTAMLLSSLASCCTIQSLDLFGTTIYDENAHLVANIIRNNPNLIELKLAACMLSKQALQTIFAVFKEKQVIERCQIHGISLANNRFGAIGLQDTIEILKNIKTLKSLDLSNIIINDVVVVKLAELIVDVNLMSIKLNKCLIGLAGIKLICEALKTRQANNFETALPIDLDLFGNYFGMSELLELAELINNNVKVNGLWLDTTVYSNLLPLINAANNNSHLRILACVIKSATLDWDAKNLLEAMEALKHNHTVTDLNLGGEIPLSSELLIDLFKDNCTLTNFAYQLRFKEQIYKINILISELLNQHVFANIAIRNEILFALQIKSLLCSSNMPNALIKLLESDFASIPRAKNKKEILENISHLLVSCQTPFYINYLQNYVELTRNLLNVDLMVVHNELVKNCQDDARLTATASGTSINATNQTLSLLLPTLIIECPSLKNLCLNVIALQIISDKLQPHSTLSGKQAALPLELVSELNLVKRMLPPVISSQNNNHDHNNNKKRQLINKYCTPAVGLFSVNHGVQLLRDSNEENDKDNAATNNQTPMIRRFYLANR